MLRKCKNNEQVVSVLVQHFAETHAALKSAVLPRAAVGGPRKWFLKHSDYFQLGAPDNYGQSIVRLKQVPSAAPAPSAGSASQSEEREAVAILLEMLRKAGGKQVTPPFLCTSLHIEQCSTNKNTSVDGNNKSAETSLYKGTTSVSFLSAITTPAA